MNPANIEQESFRIIRSELGDHLFSEQNLMIVLRVIHATADFEYKDILRFSPQAVEKGILALRNGCRVMTDVQMVAAGMRRDLLAHFGSSLLCEIDHPDVRMMAQENNSTRAAAAFRKNANLIDGSIVVVGNAPTALYEVIHQVRSHNFRPALVMGVPVGFVAAAESKKELADMDIDWIITEGRKGGSTVAAAIMNAILLLAKSSG